MKRILIVRTDRVGDVVMMTPMIRELRRTFPDAFIVTLTQPYAKSILLHNPHLDLALTDDLRKETFWSCVKELRQYRFTDGLLLMPTERAAYQMFFAGISNRIGVGRKLYEVITFMKSVSRKNYTPLRHEADYCMDLARRIGVRTENVTPEVFISDRERGDVTEFLQSRGVTDEDYRIIVHTSSGGSAPNWSEAKYLALLKTMLKEFSELRMKILLTAREMSDGFRNVIRSFGGNTFIDLSQDLHDLRDLIKVIAKANLYIGASTGPIHLADALNIRCIGLHCHRPMNCIQHWGVLNGRSINLEISDPYCRSHCSKDQTRCAFEDGIGMDEVLAAVKSFMDH